jgi:hypothetical protein
VQIIDRHFIFQLDNIYLKIIVNVTGKEKGSSTQKCDLYMMMKLVNSSILDKIEEVLHLILISDVKVLILNR